VDVMLPIGDFAKMTHLTVKALRHYHDVGLLEPAEIDPVTGYRRYAASQVTTAQAIRRFRDLGMPIAEVREVLDAGDLVARNRAILTHLDRMQEQLERTQITVASLQALLVAELDPRARVEVRRIALTRVLLTRAAVAFEDCSQWLEPALAGLHAAAEMADLVVAGADGALYPDEFFESGIGEVTAFVPVARDAADVVHLPATTVAVLVHDGPFADLDQAYGALGTVVAERGIGGRGPIREHYLTATSTEVCWPVTGSTSPVTGRTSP
jgi:DNA-binding transcriptional MerR regulator/effector-binding domain-containing protein